MIHLDTGFVIRALLAGSDADRALRRWAGEGVPLVMSCVAWAELLCGPLKLEHAELAARVIGERAPLTESDAALAAELFNRSGRRRGSLADCLIAATAIRATAPLATTNPHDFARLVPLGLELEEYAAQGSPLNPRLG